MDTINWVGSCFVSLWNLLRSNIYTGVILLGGLISLVVQLIRALYHDE